MTVKAPVLEAPPSQIDTRAVWRIIDRGSDVDCAYCGNRLRFRKWMEKSGEFLVILCNVYKGPKGRRKWDRLEWYHYLCYLEAGKPHGEIYFNNNNPRELEKITKFKKLLDKKIK